MPATMKIDLKSKLTAVSPTDAFQAMFTSNSKYSENIVELPICELTPYPNQPFRPYQPDKLVELAEDIKENGVISPIIVRDLEGEFQILAGHNRVAASRMAGLEVVPCIIKHVDDETAKLIMVNTNLNQRQKLLPSEKAFAYKIQLEALTQLGKTEQHVHIVHKTDNIAFLSESMQESKRNISYCLRLTFLIPEILNSVDDGEIPVRAGVQLSYLSAETQKRIAEYVTAYGLKITMEMAERLRETSQDGELLRGEIANLLTTKKINPSKNISLKFRSSELQQFFPDKSEKEMQAELLVILKKHFRSK